MKTFRGVCLVLVAIGWMAAGCNANHSRSTSVLEPSAVIPSLLGSWTSQSITPAATSGQSCSNFTWNVTTQTSSDIAGTFTAVCLGTANISGSATGHIENSTLSVSVNGTGSMPNVPNCAFSLSGSGPIVGDTIKLPYSGTTCLGPLSGTVTLRKSDVVK
jgi:hypothetical protein